MAGTKGTHDSGELPDETPPGPGGLPLLGNTIDLYRDPWEFYGEIEDYGDVVSYNAAGNDFTVLMHPDYIEQVLVTEPEKFGKWGFESIGGDFGAQGLVQTEGDQSRWPAADRIRPVAYDALSSVSTAFRARPASA